MICERCQEKTWVHRTSWFNLQAICLECANDESLAPNYALARKTEDERTTEGIRLMRAGEPTEKWRPLLSFEGIGLAPEDEWFLASRLASRRSRSNTEV